MYTYHIAGSRKLSLSISI